MWTVGLIVKGVTGSGQVTGLTAGGGDEMGRHFVDYVIIIIIIIIIY